MPNPVCQAPTPGPSSVGEWVREERGCRLWYVGLPPLDPAQWVSEWGRREDADYGFFCPSAFTRGIEERGKHFFNLALWFYKFRKNRVGHPFFSKERNILAIFSVLYKRMQRSLRSFLFFIKEHGVLCILFRSLKKNVAFFAFFLAS